MFCVTFCLILTDADGFWAMLMTPALALGGARLYNAKVSIHVSVLCLLWTDADGYLAILMTTALAQGEVGSGTTPNVSLSFSLLSFV